MSDVSREEIYYYVKAYFRAMVVGTSLALFVHSKEVRRKAYLMVFGAVVMVVTSDMKWNKKKLPNPDLVKGKAGNSTKRVIFIRHGESLWNEAFNGPKRPDKFLFRTLQAFFGEFMLLSEFDSVLLDSPLNGLGFGQAKNLARALSVYPKGREHDRSAQLDADVAVLRGDDQAPSSVITSSNLRRAAQTAVVALWGRIGPGNSGGGGGGGGAAKVKVLSCLQEISRNVDTLSLTPAEAPVPLQGVAEALGLEVPLLPLFFQPLIEVASQATNPLTLTLSPVTPRRTPSGASFAVAAPLPTRGDSTSHLALWPSPSHAHIRSLNLSPFLPHCSKTR